MKNVKYLLGNALIMCATGTLVGCSGDDKATDTTPAPTQATGLSACGADNAARPGEVLAMVDAIKKAVEGKGDSSQISLYSMPNHRSAFWDTPKLGYERAKQELGTLGDWVFPPSKESPLPEIVAAQQANMSNWTMQGVSGIALSVKSAADMLGPINSAISTGIPVVTFDSDAADSSRFLYVGPLSQPSGVLAGNELVKAMGTTTGVVVVLSGKQSEVYLQERLAGAKGPIEAAGFTLDTVWDLTDGGIVAAMDAAFAKHGDKLKGFLTMTGTFAPLAGAYIRDKGHTGKVRMVGWDLKVETQQLIDAGVVHAMLAQRSYFHGYLPVYLNYAITTLGKEKVMATLAGSLSGTKGDLLNTGVDVVTKENLTSYLQYQTECLGVASN